MSRIVKFGLCYSGAIAQLGERLHGMQEVGGSIPPSSTSLPTAVLLDGIFMLPVPIV